MGGLTDGRRDAQAIRTPSVLNVAFAPVLHWNGQFGSGGPNFGSENHWTPGTPKSVNRLGYDAPETQAIAGLSIHGMTVTPARLYTLGYRDGFLAAFGTLPQNPSHAAELTGLAIAAYERTLLPTRAPFQRWLRGELHAMTATQLRGATIFYGAGACATCHSGATLSDGDFHVLGLPDLYAVPESTVNAGADMGVNLGRAGFTHRTSDLYAFKTPQLYNLADSPYYGHGSSHRSLNAMVRYHLEGQSANPRVADTRLDPNLRQRRLSDRAIADLVSFLEEGLRDPDLARYTPASVPRRKPAVASLQR